MLVVLQAPTVGSGGQCLALRHLRSGRSSPGHTPMSVSATLKNDRQNQTILNPGLQFQPLERGPKQVCLFFLASLQEDRPGATTLESQQAEIVVVRSSP